MRIIAKISILFSILMVDLIFFIVIRQYFPEGYDWIIATTSFHTHISVEATRTLFIIGGFIIALITVPVILYFIYNAVKKL